MRVRTEGGVGEGEDEGEGGAPLSSLQDWLALSRSCRYNITHQLLATTTEGEVGGRGRRGEGGESAP